MGKNDGFMIYKRVEDSWIEPSSRIKNFKEFHNHLDDKERREQAARCMNCGVPMCQSAIKLAGMVTGCPLHNFIPEWNDALYKGQYDMAAWRLLKTSSFPEFTGRVCPALCEKACNCGNGGDIKEAVTIHDNELYIIEKAFESGYMKPQIPKVRSDKKIAVIGSGPAGLAVADLLNRRGHNVTVYERDDRIGGLLMYGIPNMKLDKKIVERRVNLMKAEGVTFITNADAGRNVDAKQLLSEYDAVALCCGAKKPRPLSAQGSEAQGIMFAVDWLKSVTKSLLDSDFSDKNFFDPKGKHVVILGGGDTGNDCTGSSIRLGAASVTQLEMMPCPPAERQPNNPWPQWPKVLKTDYGAQESIEKFGHDPRVYKTTIKEVYQKDGKVCGIKTVQVEFKNVDGKRTLCEIEGSEKELPADLILIAAGFLGCEDYTANAFGVPLSPRNTIATSGADSYFTGTDKVFTAGDMHRGQSLVVWAIAEGRECAREIDEYLMGYSNL
ncbi:MAG: glutamate synthase subunit beta [Treponema succinifaciens]|uniref:glutamate synthase subunit beta n=1 Tax=Treponema succinifaciens TaxID=167 RepID=UPI00235457BA|nr:glutamate synthase subunit beta [Treponema succinifaciens]MCI6913516.1 glutamate synthase subunit beta [Treponema succinifaciens]MDY2616920.1 glutamate synthase subunit beta [Treponema succinifaciens]